ncbi:MAG: type II toxin-antitoxin system HigB family toxin [Cyanobacteria bacterium P01_A01_bin.40]
MRQIYRDAEAEGNFTVCNIKGNNYRLIVGLDVVSEVVNGKRTISKAQAKALGE